MTIAHPITPERLLIELRENKYVTGLCLAPTSPRFHTMLADHPEFAAQARAIVADKIAQIASGMIPFSDAGARHNTRRAWENCLTTIDKALGQVGSPSL